MGRLAFFLFVVFAAGCSGRTEVPARDGGLDAAVAFDAPTGADAPTLDAGARDAPVAIDAPDARLADAGRDAPSIDAGRDAPSVDAGRDAPTRDVGPLPDVPCAPYCDPVTGSYFTCSGGMLRCMCGPCSGDPLACC